MKDTNQKKFLKAFAQCGTVKGAAVAAGITRQAVYLWRSDDQAFSDAFMRFGALSNPADFLAIYSEAPLSAAT